MMGNKMAAERGSSLLAESLRRSSLVTGKAPGHTREKLVRGAVDVAMTTCDGWGNASWLCFRKIWTICISSAAEI